ncbi:putative mucin-like glycoprotein [Trypanosoma rangeli]|uniref:Putative mucin-like glycoprotein n=1 Tax=Trypanosoma rangeli TaxID=5698 RepID=A0A422MP86_TRYRA|nr:putative mucin-like glycoprotein [Trypanosoma rangeli]RNE95046.1 putative mucin-like glycoprotein [Trypanosoma rangeli]|eukprot:RNE95046.1 putative mucin-like glycoprotein [Trypanosoma rangeli]
MAMATVRHRAVCVLAVLALLCGCLSSAWGEVGPTIPAAVVEEVWLQVEVACERTEGNLKWRFSGETGWQTCAPVAEANVESPKDTCGWLCDSADALYNGSNCTDACVTRSDAVAFTMQFARRDGKQVCNRSVPANSAGTFSSVTSGVCNKKAADQTTTQKSALEPAARPSTPAANSQEKAPGENGPVSSTPLKGLAKDGGGPQREEKETTDQRGKQQVARGNAVQSGQIGKVPQSREEVERAEEEVKSDIEPSSGAAPTVEPPAASAPLPTGAPPTIPGSLPSSSQSLYDVGNEHQTAEGALFRAGGDTNDTPTRPAAESQAGGDPAQSDAHGSPGETNAASGREQEGGAERQKKTEHDTSKSTGLAQSVAGAAQALVHNTTIKSSATGNIVTNSSDGSYTTTPFVPTSLLLLLLVAALACATG